MPRSGQIIPEWLHPHEETYINDNTRYEDVAYQNNGPAFLNVFMSRKGVDNKLKKFDSVVKWVKEYGLPDYRLYGQPGYNAYVSLSTGLATSQSMRVMPTDAAYANMILLCYYQKKNNKLQLKFEVKTVTKLTDLTLLQATVDRLGSDTADADGYKVLPIMSFWSRGRGVYGNEYRVRISRDKGADKDNDYVNYTIELLTTENGSLETLEAYSVSFYIDAIDPDSNLTLFVNDIIDDSSDDDGKGSGRFDCSLEYDNLAKIFATYGEVYNEANIPTVESVATLPATSLPSTTTIYVVSATSAAWIFDSTLGTFKLYTDPVMISNAASPIVIPQADGVTLPASSVTDYYVISTSDNKVYKYNTSTGLAVTTATVHSEISLPTSGMTVNDVYKVTDRVDVTYYVATSETATNAITAISTSATLTNGSLIANTGWVFYNTTTKQYYIYDAITYTISNVTSTVSVVDALPSTTMYTAGVVYKLTAAVGTKAIGTEWVYSTTEGDWVTYTEGTAVEPMVYTMKTWDIFGYDKFTATQDAYFSFDGGTEAIGILSIEGSPLGSGTDGSFSTDTDDATRDAAIEKAYLAAFQGEYDKTISSKRRAPVDLMLDANYPLSVKKAMVALALSRYDAACHLDTNLINNVDDLETFYTQISGLSERIVSFDAHMFKTSDPITGKIIPASITLWLAAKYPSHFNIYGNHTPMAGEEYATMSGYQKNSIRPIIDADDHETKELLYNTLHMNYIECIAENTFMRGTQQTSQNFWSDLSEENNMMVLLEIKRKIERLAASNRYKWADTEELRLFKASCKEIFSSYIGTKCKTLEIDVKSNSWEQTRYIVHVYLAVVFRTFQKRAIIEIDVNPRA